MATSQPRRNRGPAGWSAISRSRPTRPTTARGQNPNGGSDRHSSDAAARRRRPRASEALGSARHRGMMAASRSALGNAAMAAASSSAPSARQLGDQRVVARRRPRGRRRRRGSGPRRSPRRTPGASSVPTASRNQMASSPTCGRRGAVDDDRRAVLEPALLLDHAATPRAAPSPASTSATAQGHEAGLDGAGRPARRTARPRSVPTSPRPARRRRRTPTSSASVATRGASDVTATGCGSAVVVVAVAAPLVVTGQRRGRRPRPGRPRSPGPTTRAAPQESPSLSLKPSVMPSSLATSVDSSTLRAMTAACAVGDGVGVVERRGHRVGERGHRLAGRGGAASASRSPVSALVASTSASRPPVLERSRRDALVGGAALGQAERRPGRRRASAAARPRLVASVRARRPWSSISVTRKITSFASASRLACGSPSMPATKLVAVAAGPVGQHLGGGRPGERRSRT